MFFQIPLKLLFLLLKEAAGGCFFEKLGKTGPEDFYVQYEIDELLKSSFLINNFLEIDQRMAKSKIVYSEDLNFSSFRKFTSGKPWISFFSKTMFLKMSRLQGWLFWTSTLDLLKNKYTGPQSEWLARVWLARANTFIILQQLQNVWPSYRRFTGKYYKIFKKK